MNDEMPHIQTNKINKQKMDASYKFWYRVIFK